MLYQKMENDIIENDKNKTKTEGKIKLLQKERNVLSEKNEELERKINLCKS